MPRCLSQREGRVMTHTRGARTDSLYRGPEILYPGLALLMHLCNSIRPSTGPSVCQSIVLSVTHTGITILTSQSQSRSKIISCNHVTIQSLCHHEDTSLALWALFTNHEYCDKRDLFLEKSKQNLYFHFCS